jgi:hypothetical protein
MNKLMIDLAVNAEGSVQFGIVYFGYQIPDCFRNNAVNLCIDLAVGVLACVGLFGVGACDGENIKAVEIDIIRHGKRIFF